MNNEPQTSTQRETTVDPSPQTPSDTRSAQVTPPQFPLSGGDTPQLQTKKSNKGAMIAIITALVVVLLVLIGAILWLVVGQTPQSSNTKQAATTTESMSNTSASPSTSTSSSQQASTQNQESDSDQALTRDSERQSDISALASKLEVYFAMNGGYPALADLNNAVWREANDIGTTSFNERLADPLSPNTAVLLGAIPSGSTGGYAYLVSPAGCSSLSDATGKEVSTTQPCTSFELVALLEGSSTNSNNTSSSSAQRTYVKSSAN